MMKKIVLITLVIAFLLGMNADVKSQTITTGTIPTLLCYLGPINISIPYTITGTFNAGNVFTAEFSDINGNFNSPLNLGSVNSTSSGIINGTLSIGEFGYGYRIRVVSSSPVIIGSDN